MNLLIRGPLRQGLAKDVFSFARRLEKQLEEVHHKVCGALTFSGHVIKHSYDMRAHHVEFKEDRCHYVTREGRKASHLNYSHWDAPYKVVERYSDGM